MYGVCVWLCVCVGNCEGMNVCVYIYLRITYENRGRGAKDNKASSGGKLVSRQRYTHTPTYTHRYTHTFIQTHTHTHTFIHTHTHPHSYKHTHPHIHTCTHTHTIQWYGRDSIGSTATSIFVSFGQNRETCLSSNRVSYWETSLLDCILPLSLSLFSSLLHLLSYILSIISSLLSLFYLAIIPLLYRSIISFLSYASFSAV